MSGATPEALLPRLFAAVQWDAREADALRELQALLRSAPGADRWRWLAPDDLHLTLRFYGDARPAQADAATATLQRVAARLTAERLEFARLDAWPGVVVARFDASARLQALQAELESAAQELGFEADPRPWAPHVTLARTDRGGVELPRLKLAPFALPVARLALCRRAAAAAAAAGRRYETLAAFDVA